MEKGGNLKPAYFQILSCKTFYKGCCRGCSGGFRMGWGSFPGCISLKGPSFSRPFSAKRSLSAHQRAGSGIFWCQAQAGSHPPQKSKTHPIVKKEKLLLWLSFS